MICKDCEHFEILYEPEKIGGQLVDWGRAHCKKYDLVTEFRSYKKFETLSCIKKEDEMIERRAGEIPTLDTRGEANETVDREKRYKQIIEIMQENGLPMTAKEIAVSMWSRGYTPTDERNFSAPRLTELSKKGIVEPCGKEKCIYTGKTVAVYRLM